MIVILAMTVILATTVILEATEILAFNDRVFEKIDCVSNDFGHHDDYWLMILVIDYYDFNY